MTNDTTEQLEVLRRIAERGMNAAHDSAPQLIDLFQHLLDEIERTKKWEGRATEKELGEVHGGLAKWCLEIMKGVPLLDRDGRAVLKEDGQPWLVPPAPAHLNVIRQFLKDNRIEAAVIPGMGDDKDLDDLPVFEDDNVVPISKSR